MPQFTTKILDYSLKYVCQWSMEVMHILPGMDKHALD